MFQMFGLGTRGTIGTKETGGTKRAKHYKSNRKPVDTFKPVIGKVYADWCGHCQTLKPIWAEMKTEIHANFPDKYTFSEIEEKQKDAGFAKIKKDYKVGLKADGYPTLFKIMKGGKVEYYEGARDKDSMKNWFIGGNSVGGKRSKRNKTSKRKRVLN